MRAKLIISNVQTHGENAETLQFRAVSKSDAYDESGVDENNTFALFTPSADLTMCINNPSLINKFKAGDSFYVDFTQITKGN